MPVECVLSNLGSDVRCAVCGQGFLLFAQGLFPAHREHLRQLVQSVLRLHHNAGTHPTSRFHIAVPAGLFEALQVPIAV